MYTYVFILFLNNNLIFKETNYVKYLSYNILPYNLKLPNIFSSTITTKKLTNLQLNTRLELNTGTLINSFKSNFTYLRINLFNLFFSKSKVEVPKPLLNLKTLINPINQVTVFKFNNYLMLHGLFLKSLLSLNLAWHNSQTILNTSTLKQLNWWRIYSHIIYSNYNTLEKHTNNTLKYFLNKFFKKIQPIFTLYIYKINKNIYKNTRGKSGKFMFVWKYVPVYKRLFIVSTWLIKELRVLPQKSLKARLTQLIINVYKNPLKTWPNRVKVFSYNYIYKNCYKTLASTYMSTKA